MLFFLCLSTIMFYPVITFGALSLLGMFFSSFFFFRKWFFNTDNRSLYCFLKAAIHPLLSVAWSIFLSCKVVTLTLLIFMGGFLQYICDSFIFVFGRLVPEGQLLLCRQLIASCGEVLRWPAWQMSVGSLDGAVR